MQTSEFGKWLRKWRKARGLTQDELGQKIGFTGKYVSVLERGWQQASGEFVRPSEEFVEKAATELRRPVEEARALAGYTPSPVPVTMRTVTRILEAQEYVDGEIRDVELTPEVREKLSVIADRARELFKAADELLKK
jgi:transcriptional regulator with XRE-family HTH domain